MFYDTKIRIFFDKAKNSSYFCTKKHLITDKMTLIILGAWLIFVAIVYLLMWFDTAYYKYNLPSVYRKVLDTFTEED